MFGQHVGLSWDNGKESGNDYIIIGYVGGYIGVYIGVTCEAFFRVWAFRVPLMASRLAISTVVVQVSHPLIAQNKAFDGEAVGSIEVLKERHRARRVALQEKRRHDRSDTLNSQL